MYLNPYQNQGIINLFSGTRCDNWTEPTGRDYRSAETDLFCDLNLNTSDLTFVWNDLDFFCLTIKPELAFSSFLRLRSVLQWFKVLIVK